MGQNISSIVEDNLEDVSYADICLLGKGLRNMVIHGYYEKVLVFSDDILQLELPIMDASTTVRKDDDNKIIIRINQAIYTQIKM